MRLRRPSWFAVALTVAGMALFVRLGVWQLHRADYKERLLRLFATAASAPAENFAAVQAGVPADRYPHVRVRGHFIAGREYILDDQIHANRVGVQVYSPFRVDGSERLLLVNLGFLPRPKGAKAPPYLPPLKSGERVLHGLYVPPPRPGLKLGGNALGAQAQWPKTSIYLDLGEVGHDLGATLYPRVLLLDADPSKAYIRQWTPTTMPPSRHRGYAFQWFAFALAALVIFVVLHRRRDTETRQDD